MRPTAAVIFSPLTLRHDMFSSLSCPVEGEKSSALQAGKHSDAACVAGRDWHYPSYFLNDDVLVLGSATDAKRRGGALLGLGK